MKKIIIVGVLALSLMGCSVVEESSTDVEEITVTTVTEDVTTIEETTVTDTTTVTTSDDVIVVIEDETKVVEETTVEETTVTEDTTVETTEDSECPRRDRIIEEEIIEDTFQEIEYCNNFVDSVATEYVAPRSVKITEKIIETVVVTKPVTTIATTTIETTLSAAAQSTLSISQDDYTLLCKLVASEYGGMSDVYERSKIVASIMNRVNSNDFPNTIKKVIDQGCVPYGFNPSKEYYCSGSVHYSEMSDAVDYYFNNLDLFSSWTADSWWGDGIKNHFYKI